MHCSWGETLPSPRCPTSNVGWLLTSVAPWQYYRQSRHRRKAQGQASGVCRKNCAGRLPHQATVLRGLRQRAVILRGGVT
jgi:hypothetical protein